MPGGQCVLFGEPGRSQLRTRERHRRQAAVVDGGGVAERAGGGAVSSSGGDVDVLRGAGDVAGGKTRGLLVRWCWSTVTKPRASVVTPAASSPRPSVFACGRVATSSRCPCTSTARSSTTVILSSANTPRRTSSDTPGGIVSDVDLGEDDTMQCANRRDSMTGLGIR